MSGLEIEIQPHEYREMGEKYLDVTLDHFQDPLSVKDLLIAIEALNSLSKMFVHQLNEYGVEVGYRREVPPN